MDIEKKYFYYLYWKIIYTDVDEYLILDAILTWTKKCLHIPGKTVFLHSAPREREEHEYSIIAGAYAYTHISVKPHGISHTVTMHTIRTYSSHVHASCESGCACSGAFYYGEVWWSECEGIEAGGSQMSFGKDLHPDVVGWLPVRSRVYKYTCR